MKNPSDKIEIIWDSGISITLITISLIMFSLFESGDDHKYFFLFGSITLFILGLGFLFMIIVELFGRPIEIDADDEQITLHFRSGKTIKMSYDSIEHLRIEQQPNKIGQKRTGGAIKFVHSKRGFWISHVIAEEIKKNYSEKKGCSPP